MSTAYVFKSNEGIGTLICVSVFTLLLDIGRKYLLLSLLLTHVHYLLSATLSVKYFLCKEYLYYLLKFHSNPTNQELRHQDVIM